MLKKSLLFAAAAIAVVALPLSANAQSKIKIGFLPGTVDPFYQNMQRGVEQAAKDLGVDVVTQIPPSWGVEQETPLLNALVARGDLNYIISAPVDVTQMVAPFQAANDAGIKVITVDTFLGDGDYANGPVKFPLSFLGSNNEEGGKVIADGPRQGGRRQGYGVSAVDQSERVVGRRPREGLQGRDGGEPSEHHRHRPGLRLDDQAKATQMTAAVIEQHPDLVGVFGTNVFSAQGAAAAVTNAGLAGKVSIATWGDASAANMENLDKGIVSQVLAQKPFDMGYLAVEFAVARCGRRDQPAQARRDRLRRPRQDQRGRPELLAVHLQVAAGSLRRQSAGRRVSRLPVRYSSFQGMRDVAVSDAEAVNPTGGAARQAAAGQTPSGGAQRTVGVAFSDTDDSVFRGVGAGVFRRRPSSRCATPRTF